MEEIFFLIMIGLFVGALTGMTGASGVLILVPVLSTLPIFSYISMPIILSTSLMVDVVASLAVSSTYALAKNNEPRKVWGILLGTVIGTQIGAYLIISIPKIWVIIVIAFGMTAFGLKMLQERKEKELSNLKDNFFFSKKPAMMIFWGIIVGLSTGIFGAGGGVMIFIILYYFLRFSLKKAVGTSTFIMIFTSFFGVIGYIYNNNVDFHLSLILCVSAAVGGFISSFFANRIKDGALSNIIGTIFILSALAMFIFKAVIPLI